MCYIPENISECKSVSDYLVFPSLVFVFSGIGGTLASHCFEHLINIRISYLNPSNPQLGKWLIMYQDNVCYCDCCLLILCMLVLRFTLRFFVYRVTCIFYYHFSELYKRRSFTHFNIHCSWWFWSPIFMYK